MSRLPPWSPALAALLLGACAVPQVYIPEMSMPRLPDKPAIFGMPPQTTPFAGIPYASWQEQEPAYRFYPGDVIDVSFPTAPELNRTVTVKPDGRIDLQYIAPVMASDRTAPELQYMLVQAYSSQLQRPQIELSLKTATPIKVFIGGEVDKPGVYDMPGDINALQAIIMAGGAKPTGKLQQVIIVRRGFNDQAELTTVDLRRATFTGSGAVALRRFDVIYVPRTTIANVDIFMQQYIRDAIPIQFSSAVSPVQYVTTK